VRATVNLLTREGSKGATESTANTILPDDQELEVTVWHEKELRELRRLANKLNRITRSRVNSPIREGSKGARESIANSTLPWNQEGEAMAQCEMELREHCRLANMSNRSMTVRVDSLTREGSEQDSESKANSTLAQNQEREETTQHEKELREHGRSANKSNIIATREGIEGDSKSMANTMLLENEQGEATT